MIAVIALTDGRTNLLRRTIASFDEQVSGNIVERFIYDDSGFPKNTALLRKQHPGWTVTGGNQREGFAGAVRACHDIIRQYSTSDYVFHLEDDFTFNRPINLDDLQDILEHRKSLAQVALLRQPWNDAEIAAGGVLELNPDGYTPYAGLNRNQDTVHWLEQDRFFTTNPSLFRRELIEMFEWPAGSESEGRFSIEVTRAGFNFAYWGEMGDGPAVHHIGKHRQGVGY